MAAALWQVHSMAIAPMLIDVDSLNEQIWPHSVDGHSANARRGTSLQFLSLRHIVCYLPLLPTILSDAFFAIHLLGKCYIVWLNGWRFGGSGAVETILSGEGDGSKWSFTDKRRPFKGNEREIS